jgi:hypothetical protein
VADFFRIMGRFMSELSLELLNRGCSELSFTPVVVIPGVRGTPGTTCDTSSLRGTGVTGSSPASDKEDSSSEETIKVQRPSTPFMSLISLVGRFAKFAEGIHLAGKLSMVLHNTHGVNQTQAKVRYRSAEEGAGHNTSVGSCFSLSICDLRTTTAQPGLAAHTRDSSRQRKSSWSSARAHQGTKTMERMSNQVNC